MQSPSPITLRLFVALMVLIGGVLGANYWFSVPLVQKNVFGIELNTNRQVLDIVYDFADRIYFDAEANVEATIQSHEQRLRSIVELTASHIKTMRDQNNFLQQRSVDMSAIFEQGRDFKLNNDDYIWIADYNGKFLAHPLDSLHQKTAAQQPGNEENVIFKIIEEVRKNGDGVFRYKWQRLTKPDVTDKYSYVKNFPEWGVVIGSGIYLEDIEKETEARKARALSEIAEVIKDIRIAQNGYLYLFNSDGQMLFHPNPNIHGKNFTEQLNPVTGIPIYVDLIAAADTGSELFYKWDRPDDQGNYVYEKYSLVRHFSAFDWYIASSVYLDDLKASSVQLRLRLLAIGFFALLVSIIAAFFFAESITSPIRRLSQTAFKISRGALNTKTDIRRNDELGVLAESIDQMVDKLRDNIYILNTRVEQRTQELSKSNQQLQITVERLQKTQLEMLQVEQRQRLILNALPAQIAYLDGDERFIFANKAYHEVFAHGYVRINCCWIEKSLFSLRFSGVSINLNQPR